MRMLQRAYRGWWMNPIWTALSLLFLSSGCGTHLPPPQPWPTPTPSTSPTPTPTPVPPVAGPLVAMPDGTWQRDGKPWKMRMVVVCCKGYPDADPRDLAKEANWPLTSKEFTQWISFHGQNATEIRPLMCPIHEGGAFFSPYRIPPREASDTSPLRVDLGGWNPAFWTYVDDLIEDGARKGVVFMVGVVDTWPVDHGLSPWCGSCNTGGANWCDSGVLKGVPPPLALAFARKVYEETGKYSNVIYQDGNEVFEATSAAWTLQLRDLLRQVEGEKHYVRHPYGTQQRDDALRAAVDFVTAEQDTPAGKWCGPAGCKPTIVNESALGTSAAVLRSVYHADDLGSSFAYWMGDHTQDQRGQTLIALEGWALGKPIPDWAACPTCPAIGGMGAKVQQFQLGNRTVKGHQDGDTWIAEEHADKFNLDCTVFYGCDRPKCDSEHNTCLAACEDLRGPRWDILDGSVRNCHASNPGDDGRGYGYTCETGSGEGSARCCTVVPWISSETGQRVPGSACKTIHWVIP